VNVNKERRHTSRMQKKYQVFCKVGEHSSIGESYDITEKGVSVCTNLELQRGDSIEVRIVPRDEIFSFTCVGTVRHCQHIQNGDSFKYRVGVEFIEGLKDFAMDQIVGSYEDITARKSLVINASPQDCYDAICDFESYPSWQKLIQSVKVIEYDDQKRPEVVEFWLDAILKKVKFVNKYEYFPEDFIMSWKAANGDIKTNEGSYVFKKLREGKTNAIFSLHIELGFYAPKRILDYMNNISMRNSIRALKEIVESGKLNKK